MPSVQRLGDVNTLGGAATLGVPTVLVNNLPIVVTQTPVAAHWPCGQPDCADCQRHCTATTVAFRNVLAGNRPVVTTGDPDTCGCVRIGGSPNVRIGPG